MVNINTLGGTSTHVLTATAADAALPLLQRVQKPGASMGDIVERILRSHEGGVSGNVRGKMRNYINLLASTGKTDEQLLQLGKAYLKEIQNPDPRYSGC